MKKIIISMLLLITVPVFAEEPVKSDVQHGLTSAQNILFENCTKIFELKQEELFYLTLGAVSANRFTIDEIQTANGYIIFTANKNKYLASAAKIDNKNSILKITPCNNVYNFPPGIITNMFKYIELNEKSI